MQHWTALGITAAIGIGAASPGPSFVMVARTAAQPGPPAWPAGRRRHWRGGADIRHPGVIGPAQPARLPRPIPALKLAGGLYWLAGLAHLAGLEESGKSNKVWCLVRRIVTSNALCRSVVAQYADAPDSTKTEGRLRQQYSIDQPMLILIRQNGSEENEWRGAPFYWLIISAQENARRPFSRMRHKKNADVQSDE